MSDPHASASAPAEDEPKTPMWLPALGGALFVAAGLWWAVTPGAPPPSTDAPAASASASAAPAATGAPQPQPVQPPALAASALPRGLSPLPSGMVPAPNLMPRPAGSGPARRPSR